MPNRQLAKRIHLLVVFALLITMAAQAVNVPVEAAPKTLATARAQAAEESVIPPVLLSTTPLDGAAWDGSPVIFVFDQPMAAAEIAVTPALEGQTSVAENTVTFTPTTTPAPNTRYHFTFVAASAQSGAALTSQLEIALQSTGPLGVSTTQPADGAEDVDPNTAVTVIFNRPVVPLLGIDEQSTLPQPLSFTPAVEGTGEWISTSVYQFRPAAPLAAATSYVVAVDALTGVDGATMDGPHSFSFSTAAPIVLSVLPQGIFVAPDTDVQVTFSQPMDRASTEAAFQLTGKGLESSVQGSFSWNITGTIMSFTPAALLDFGREYTIQVAQSAQPASKEGTLRADFSKSFTVVPLPMVDTTSILPDAQGVNPEQELRIRFTAPVSESMLFDAIRIEPVVTGTQIISYTYTDFYDITDGNMEQVNMEPVFGYGTHLMLNWYKMPSTAYTVTIAGTVADAYGNTLGEDYVLHFSTGDYPPLVRIDLDRFTHYSAYTTTVVGVKYRNVETIDAKLYRVPLNDLFQLAGENQWSVWDQYVVPDQAQNLIWSRTYSPTGGRNVIQTHGIKLTGADDQPLPPGVYMLEIRNPPGAAVQYEGQPAVQRAVLVLTNYNLTFKRGLQGTSLAWLTDLRSGQPVEGAEVVFTKTGRDLARATTGSDGIAAADMDVRLEEQWVPFFAYSGEPGQDDFAVVSSDWDDGIEPWSFNISTGGPYDQLQVNMYTERPIYRPGQTVYWKGIVRVLQNDEWILPAAGQQINIKINDTLGNQVFADSYAVSENGIFEGTFDLAPDAITGYYSINAELPRGDQQPYMTSAYFQVASYRKPEFEITVKTDKPEYIQGDTVKATVQASYFSGGALVSAPVNWRLIGYGYVFNWQDAPSGRYYSFEPFDPEQPEYNPYNSGYVGLIQEGAGKTNADGTFTLELPADLGSAVASQNWMLDVTVTSPTNQQVFNSIQFPVHRGAYYIGLSPASYVVRAGEPADVDIVTLKPDGSVYASADLDVIVYEFQWNSVYEQAEDGNYYWTSSAQRTPVYTTTVTTDRNGAGTVTFTPEAGGQYQITATGQDDAGNTIRSATFIWSSSGEFIAWPRQNNDRIELVADKKLYAPGETARILVPNPFSGTINALVTVERSGVLEANMLELAGSGETLEIPVTADHIPNIYVSVVLVKGVDETNPFPATRVGYVKLAVDTAEKELTIDVAPSATTVRPGDTVTYTLTVRDHKGSPVANASTSVAVVDKAVLVLSQYYGSPQRMVDIYYYERPLGVTTGSLVVINKDRISQQLAESGKGGGGGGGDGLEIREEFADTAFWRADFVSDENGVIEFSVKLPENLTTWRLTAKAITPDTRVGEVTNDIVATKELQVRPLLPRFFTAGDRAVIGGMVANFGREAVTGGEFTIDVAGAFLETTTTVQPFTLDAPGDFVTFNYPVAVDARANSVVVTVTAAAGDRSDGVKIEIPVLHYQTPETVGTSGVVPPGGMAEAIYVPANATDDGELSVTLDPSLGAGLLEGLTYLEHYPYECNEQTVSRFLPNLFTVRALRELNIHDQMLENRLAYQLGIGVQRLVSRQNPDGGWGYWSREVSAPFITAYVLWGLNNADAMGYAVSPETRNRAASYLGGQFRAPKDIVNTYQLNEMAFVHYVLADMERGDTGRMSTLYDVRERLSVYGKAFLAMAMYKADPSDARVQTLLDELAGAANLTAAGASWSEPSIDYVTMGSDTRSTAIVLAAFVTIRPDAPILPNVVRWLMSARTAGRWATTQETAWSIIALTDWMVASGELEADYDWTVTLNGEDLASGHYDQTNIMEQATLRRSITELLRDQANLLRIDRSEDPGQLYYTTYLRYNRDALAVEPLDRGIVLERRFELDGKRIATAAVGDVISVTLTIAAPTDLYHLLVEAPIPAGTEPLDPSLAITPEYIYGPPELKSINASQGGWHDWTPSFADYRDDKVALFATYLPAGTYEYTFQVRASLPGEFRVLPARAEMMYFPEVWGRTGGQLFTVTK